MKSTDASATAELPVPALHEHDQVPHFVLSTLDGRRVQYDEIWQRRQLVLVLIRPDDRADAVPYAWSLTRRLDEFNAAEAELVITDESVPGLYPPCVLVADRWGEILHLDTLSRDDPRSYPSADELLGWVWFARIQCPECPP